jgi:hypothetical protein
MKMKTVPVEMQTVDMQTGKVIEQRAAPFKLLPPRADVCQVCAVKHDPLLPHDQMSLYYQYAFYGAVGRWPTWADACSHCEPAMIARWRATLESFGRSWSDPPKGSLPVHDLGPVIT